MKRHYKPNAGAIQHNVRASDAGWKYISFSVFKLESGCSIGQNTRTEEVVIVPLIGHFTIAYADKAHTIGRKDLFRESTDIVYLPPHTDFCITASEALEVAIGRAPAVGKLPPRLIRSEDMSSFIRGGANVSRGVNVLLDSGELAERLIAYEIRPPSGNWSSFPPHRHDGRGQSSYHEETYYYRLMPVDGFALQRIYTRDTDLDIAVSVSDGDLMLVHEGYHAVVNAPGTNAYYLNFLAGDVPRLSPVNDPHYDWVKEHWDGRPIDIPVP